MKNLRTFVTFTFFFFSFFTVTAQNHTNAGFAVVAGLGEGRAFTTQTEAYDRFIQAFQNPTLAPFFEERGEQCYRNAKKTLGGRYRVSAAEWVDILKWCKQYPDSAGVYGVSVELLPTGSYTFETLNGTSQTAVKGSEIVRRAHAGEWVLEVWGQKVASSWCLNLFASVGVIQTPARPNGTSGYIPPLSPVTFNQPKAPPSGCEAIGEWEPGPERGECHWLIRVMGMEPDCNCDYRTSFTFYKKGDGTFLYLWERTWRDRLVGKGHAHLQPWFVTDNRYIKAIKPNH